MGLYNKQGLYSGYKKNNQEREAQDFYATPPAEVTNILEITNLDFEGCSILEPCYGAGHMVKGILDYWPSKNITLYTSDIKERENILAPQVKPMTGDEFDFLSDTYPYNKADYVIMNPPYSTIEPFVIRGLEIAQKGLLVLGRLQFLEGKGRYANIFKDNPPSDVYVYVDRIKCFKNGDFSQTEASAQAYAWFYWDKQKEDKSAQLHWIRRK